MIPRYRVWDKQTERMHIVSGIDFNDGLVSSVNIWHEGWPWVLEPDEIVLMQSTGLKDKDGGDVYQGDIIRCTRGCPHEVIWLEKYGGTFFGGMPAWYLSGLSNGYAWTGREEVIGNIYENSELLEEQR
ncbi:DNA-packaging protein [Enterococcus durans]|uniref:YopX family protein n=1 Tax=Enterococcus durans TaxID=53345 RepID=UPI00188065DB|nr:YopX family protein [Enterococcus durans]MBE8849086.1 DNA-packaging protein [Enterococcus durans]